MAEVQVLGKSLRSGLRQVPGIRAVQFIYRLVRGVESRNAALMLRRPPDNLFQPYGTTAENRHPLIFRTVWEQIGDGGDRRVLSFGCSTGEEVFSLRRHFPMAAIVGLDINPHNIAVCRTRLRRSADDKVTFAVAGSTLGEASESYDAIFAMSVFRHGDLNVSPPSPTCGHRIRFADFERSVTDLARCLKPGGLLVIRHAMFRFADTHVAAMFTPVLGWIDPKDGPFYGRDERCLPGVLYPDAVFRKQPYSPCR